MDIDVIMIVHLCSWALLISGCIFLCVGGIGLVRFPDVYTRIHAASVTDTGGAAFVLMGLLIQAIFIFDNPMAAIKLFLIAFFMFLTGPTASHALAKTALMNNLMPLCQDGKSVVEKSLLEGQRGVKNHD